MVLRHGHVTFWGFGTCFLSLDRVILGVTPEFRHTKERVSVVLVIVKTHAQMANLHAAYNFISQEMN